MLMNGARIILGRKETMLRKLPLLVQLITETFILLVNLFSSDAFPDLMFAASA